MAPRDAKTTGQKPWTTGLALGGGGEGGGPQQHAAGPFGPVRDHVDAVVDAIAAVDVELARRTKQGLVAGTAPAVAVAGRVVLGVGLCLNNHSPQQRTAGLAADQQATDQLRGHHFGRAAEEAAGQGSKI